MARKPPKCAKWFSIIGCVLLVVGMAGMALRIWLWPLTVDAGMPWFMFPFLAGAVSVCIGVTVSNWRLLLGIDDEEDWE
jgi:hypothetical protein